VRASLREQLKYRRQRGGVPPRITGAFPVSIFVKEALEAGGQGETSPTNIFIQTIYHGTSTLSNIFWMMSSGVMFSASAS
jgi:hypothetical protein